MTSVFVPVAFMTGPVGVFYRQFSITMATSIVLSGVVALTLTPVLCAMILQEPRTASRSGRTPIAFLLDGFNRAVRARSPAATSALLQLIVNRRARHLRACWRCSASASSASTRTLPAGFVPNEDQGMIYAIIQTPPGTTLERTNDVSRAAAGDRRRASTASQSVSSLAGYEMLTEGRGSNAGTCLINLEALVRAHALGARRSSRSSRRRRKDIGAVVEFFEPPADARLRRRGRLLAAPAG